MIFRIQEGESAHDVSRHAARYYRIQNQRGGETTMSKESDNSQKKPAKKVAQEDLKKSLQYVMCPVHRISYPKGDTCPKCR